MSDEELRAALRRTLSLAVNGRMSGALLEAGYDQLSKRRTTGVEQAQLDARTKQILDDAVEEILEKVRAAGYARPPAGDLRAQLLQLGRRLKSESFSAGYSGGGSIEEMIDDAARGTRAETMSQIGEAILDELGTP